MKNKIDLINDLNNNIKLGLELVEKKEFFSLSEKIYINEILFGIIVGEILSEVWMIGLTDERIILVKKANLYGSVVNEIGLENIMDLKFESFGNSATLVIETFDKKIFRIESLNLDNAKLFGKEIANNIYSWNNKAISNLI